MRRTTIALFVAFALTLLSAIFVAAQSSQLNLLQPTVVNVTQAVPVNVTLGGVVGGQMVTLTAPMTVNVALQVRLEGRAATVTTAGQAAPAQAAAPSGPNDPEVLDQLDEFDAACNSGATKAQQKQALEAIRPFFEGREVRLVGTVEDVRDLSGGFDVIVALNGTGRDVRMDNLPEEQALSLNKDDQVMLTGKIDVSGCYAYVTIAGLLSR